MQSLIRLISWRHLRLEPLRSALMIIGIALGVAVFVAVRALNETTKDSFRALFEAGARDGDLIISGSRAGFPATTLDAIRATPGVQHAAPLFLNYASLPPNHQGGPRRYLVVGLDLLSEAARPAYGSADAIEIPDPTALAFTPRAALIERRAMTRDGIRYGQSLGLVAAVGRSKLTIVGSFDSKALLPGLGGDILVMNLPAAQAIFARKDLIDRALIKLSANADPEKTKAALRKAIGTELRVESPGQSSARSGELLASMDIGLSLASLVALLIGQFLIVNTMSMAIVRRRSEIGILRAIGATRRQLAILWFAEAAFYGLAGAAIGLAAGLGLARLSLEIFSENISKLYEAIELQGLSISSETLIAGAVSGPIATIIAAILPVREALRIAPVEAARKDLPPKDPRPRVRRLALAGLSLILAVALIGTLFQQGLGLFAGSLFQLILTLGFALLAPWGVLAFSRLSRPVLSRSLGPSGAIAGGNLAASPFRAGLTAAALMAAVGGVLAISALVLSLREAVDTWLDGILSGDIYISASAPIGTPDGTTLERKLEAELAALPGIERVSGLRFVFESIEDEPALLIAVPASTFAGRGGLPVVDGPANEIASRMQRRQLVISENFARLRKKSIGDQLTLDNARGQQRLTIAAVIVDYSSEHGTIFIDRALYDDLYNDDRVNTYNIIVKDGTPISPLVEDIKQRWGNQYDLYVMDQSSFRKEILAAVENSFEITYAMELVAIGIALLGVINTLFAAVYERTRELGVLRAIGASRRHIRTAVVAEAFLLGALASALGILSGTALGLILVKKITAGAFGWDIPYQWPIGQALFGAIATTLLAAVAGLIPAERAAKLPIVQALSYE